MGGGCAWVLSELRAAILRVLFFLCVSRFLAYTWPFCKRLLWA